MNNKRPHSSVYGAPPQPAAPQAQTSAPQQQPMAGPQQPGGEAAGGQPDYSAAWAAYYAQQGQAAAAAQAAMAPQQQHHQPQVGYPQPQPNPSYPYQQPQQAAAVSYAPSPYQPHPQQAPYGTPQTFRPPQQQPYQPPQNQAVSQPYAPNYPAVAPMQGFPPQQGYQQPNQATAYPSRPSGPLNQGGPRGPIPSGPGPSQPARLPYNAPMPQQSPQGGFPPAKRQRFDQPGAPSGAGGWDRDDRGGPSGGGSLGPGGGGGGYGPRPSVGRPMDESINAMPIGGGSMYSGPRIDRGGSEYFGGSNDGRDGMGMGSRGGRGGAYVDRMDRGGGSIRGGRGGGRGGYGDDRYEEPYGDARGGFAGRSRGRGLPRFSPPPALGRGGAMASRGDRGSFRGGRGRGGAFNTTFHNTPDAPRGPAKTRNVKIDKDASSSGHPFSSVNTIGSKSGKKAKEPEEKRTVTDFKIVGLELPELSWKWGSVPEKEREEEGKKRKADGSEAGDSANDPEAVPHPAKHRTSYFLTHGKGTTDAPELANKDMNRLRIYFDSPAGSGSGEKRGRGGIEGLRAKPGKTAGVQAARAPSEAPSAAAEKEGGDGQAVEGETPTEEDGEELDGEPMEDPSDPSKQPDGEPNTGEEEDAVEALATDIEEADTTKPTPLDAPSTSAYTPSQAYIDNEHPIEIPSSTPPPSETLAFDASAAAASLDLPEPEETGDVSMASARSSAEPEVASSALENGTTLSGTVASDKAPIEQVTSSVIPTDTSATEASSEHPEPPSSPRKPHPYTDAPILANNLRSPSPTTSHLATEHHPAPEPTPASSQTPHVPPTAQELREEKTMPIYTGPEPSPNRVSILYQQCTRRLCIDAEVVERVRVSRAEGKVEFTIRWRKGEKTSVAVLAAASSDAASGSTSAPVPAQTRADEGVKQEDEAEGEVKTEGGASPMKISSPVKQATADPIKQEESNLEMPDIPIVEKVTDASSKPAVEETTPAAVEESKEKEDSRTWDICRGILMEEMKDLDSPDAQFQPITLEGLHDLYDDVTDPASFGWTPPIHNLIASTSPADAPYPEMKTETFKVIAYLDQERPLSEPKWIKTGNVEEWLGEIFGPLEGGKGLGWRGKFEILDPEPVQAPTIASVLDSWSMNSTVGAARDRRKFKNNHLLSNPDNIFEILLRLVRGDRSGAAASVPIATSSLTGPLAAAVAPNNHYAGAQNHVSLAVVAMLKLTKEMADKAGVKSSVVDDRIADIIRSVPQQLFFKSVDGMFRESQKDKK